MYISSRAVPTALAGFVPGLEESFFQRLIATNSALHHRPSFPSTLPSSNELSISTTISSSIKSLARATSPSTSSAFPKSSHSPNNVLRAVVASPTPTNGLVAVPGDGRLNSGAIIGVTLGSIIGLILIVSILDILVLSNRIHRLFRRTACPKTIPYSEKKQLPFLPQKDALSIQSMSPSVPFYDKEIKHSRSLSLDSSGYSSRYSRSTWGWSGRDGTTLRGTREWLVKEEGPGADYTQYSVFEVEDEWEEKRESYKGAIRKGMGVQRRYTGTTVVMMDLDAEEKGGISHRTEKKRTWLLHDPLERWRRGLHPLTGKRGAGLERIGYF